MTAKFYKMRRQKMFSGVLAGLADKFNWDLPLVRILVSIAAYFSSGFLVFLYIVLTIFLPYKEDLIEEQFGTGPRKRKEAKTIKDDGWLW